MPDLEFGYDEFAGFGVAKIMLLLLEHEDKFAAPSGAPQGRSVRMATGQ